MEGSFRRKWNEHYIRSLDEEGLRQAVRQAMSRLHGIDARTAQILATAIQGPSLMEAIEWALSSQLFTVRFVEAWAKAPNRSWERLTAYWEGVFGEEARRTLLEDIADSMGEALYAEELEQHGGEVDLQYMAGKHYIDIRVGVTSDMEISSTTLNDEGRVVQTELVVGPDTTMAVEFKNYGTPVSFAWSAKTIQQEMHAGRTLKHTVLATVQDFWRFDEKSRTLAYRIVEAAGGKLLVSAFDKAHLIARAQRILDEGRRRYAG